MATTCNKNNKKANDPKYRCNSVTKRWNLDRQVAQLGVVKNCDVKNIKYKDVNYICNPTTGRLVLRSGKVGVRVLNQQAKAKAKTKTKTKTKVLTKMEKNKLELKEQEGNFKAILLHRSWITFTNAPVRYGRGDNKIYGDAQKNDKGKIVDLKLLMKKSVSMKIKDFKKTLVYYTGTIITNKNTLLPVYCFYWGDKKIMVQKNKFNNLRDHFKQIYYDYRYHNYKKVGSGNAYSTTLPGRLDTWSPATVVIDANIDKMNILDNLLVYSDRYIKNMPRKNVLLVAKKAKLPHSLERLIDGYL